MPPLRTNRKRTALNDNTPPRSSPSTSNASVPSDANNSAIDRLTTAIAQLAALQAQQATSSQQSIRRPVTNYESVPLFNPCNKDQTITKWCAKVDELSAVFGWTPEMTIHAALSRLDGLAKTWYQGLSSVKFSWEEWKVKLTSAFPPTQDFFQALNEMLARKKLPKETFAQYYYEKLALVTTCDFDGIKAVSCIIGGIEDAVVANAAKAGRHQTPESLFQYLSTVGTPSKVNATPNGSNQLGSQPLASASAQVKRNGSRDVVCHKCKKRGHYSNECRSGRPRPSSTGANITPAALPNKEVKRCDFCKRIGHLESECFSKKRARPTTESKVQ